jgi:lysophospholipid acyltransferase (LPLAT)-like uncharacterized protein
MKAVKPFFIIIRKISAEPMRIKINRFITSKPVIYFLYRLIRIYSWTIRLTVENEDVWLDHLRKGGAVLLCTWHQQFFSAIRYFQKYKHFKPSIMISQSSDGEVVAGIAKLTGWHPVRGSSSKDGRKALSNIIARLRETKLAAHILDGPRGPAGEVKGGVIHLAHAADAVIVPIHVIPQKAWFFNSWDKFFMPKPFSRVSLHFHTPIKFDAVTDPASFEAQRSRLEEIMRPRLII